MSYYLRVMCKSNSPPPAQQIIDFIKEGVYFDDLPSIEQFTAGDQPSLDVWDTLFIHYSRDKRPVILINTGPGSLLDDEIREFRITLSNFAIDQAIQRIESHLDETRRIIAIEIDRTGMTDEAWTMIDCLQSFVARNYDGLIYAPDDGYYDSSLQPVIKFNQLRPM